jgi:hypothetical protein
MPFEPDRRETIARAIHETYRSNQGGRKPQNDPAMADWDSLPEHLRESNRRQADAMFEKLRAIGCTVDEVADGGAEAIAFTPEEIERMAEMEHERWWAERRDGGWALGSRDVERKTSPYLVPWSELPEEVKEWDREAVRAIPDLLAGVGLGIRRQQTEE